MIALGRGRMKLVSESITLGREPPRRTRLKKKRGVDVGGVLGAGEPDFDTPEIHQGCGQGGAG